MMKARFAKLAITGGAMALVTMLASCEKVEERKQNFEQLANDVQDQLSHDVLGEPTDDEILQAASLEARALAGVKTEAAVLQDRTLDEVLRTESYFAVGSVIAKPQSERVRDHYLF